MCAYGGAAQTSGFGLRTGPGFGSSAALLFPVGSADSRSRSPAKGRHHGFPPPPSFLPPLRSGDGGSGISHSPLGALSAAQKSSWGKIFPFAEMPLLAARARRTARISFLDTLSLFKDSQCAKKRRLVLNIKLTEFAFLFIPPRNWSAVTRRFWLIRSLRAGSQSATTNTSARSGSESDAEPTRLPVRLFHARFQLRLSINKARDNPSSFVISMRPTKIRVLVARLSMQDS